MKSYKVKTKTMAFILLAGLAFYLNVEANQVTGTLGTSSAAADTYTFTCPTGTTQARVRVMDLNTRLNTAATVFATFGEDGNPTLAVSDTESTSTGSVYATNTLDGPGIYSVVVNKSAANLEDYIVDAQCLNNLGTSIPVALILKTNQ